MACYRSGGCGPYEMYSCSECPASKPEYAQTPSTCSKKEQIRLIDADALKEELSSLSVIITGLRSGKGVLSEFMEEYRKSILRIIDEQATIDSESKPLEAFLHPIDAYKGLKAKYLVFKADTGERVDNCFILRPDKDPAAVAALRAYAAATDNGVLAEDIYNWVGKGESLRPQAEWIDTYGNNYANHRYVCSRCEEDALYKIEANALGHERYVQALSDSCPHCGAYMKGA